METGSQATVGREVERDETWFGPEWQQVIDRANLASEADDVLFNAILTDSEHVLRRLCPAHRATQYNLRTRPHPFALPNKDDKNFIPRMMYKNIY